MKKILAWSAAALIACSPTRREAASPGMPEGSEPRGAAIAGNRVDAVLPAGRNFFVFDFAQARYQKWPMPYGAPLPAGSESHSESCLIQDTLRGDWSAPANWLALPSPGQAFSPMRAVWGPNGSFYILDRVGRRMVLYDTNAQFLSGFPLPREIRERNLERLEVHWTRDGQFSLLDLGEGKAWQYSELRSQAGQGVWRLRNSVDLPVGLKSCLWEPFFRDPCCLREAAGGAADRAQPVCFDRYFNPTNNPPAPSGRDVPQAISAGAGWVLVLNGGPACDSRPRFCFPADKGLFSTCPSEPDPALSR